MRERKNHLVMHRPFKQGDRVMATCGVFFSIDLERNPFDHEDCQRCAKIAKARGYTVFTTNPVGMLNSLSDGSYTFTSAGG